MNTPIQLQLISDFEILFTNIDLLNNIVCFSNEQTFIMS